MSTEIPAKQITASYPWVDAEGPGTGYTRGGAWMQLLKDHPAVPQSHWRKKHRNGIWQWESTKHCNYDKCPHCPKKPRQVAIERVGDALAAAAIDGLGKGEE